MMPIPALPDSPSQQKDTLNLAGQSTAEIMLATPTGNADIGMDDAAPSTPAPQEPQKSASPVKMSSSSKATASRNRDTRLPSARTGSVFDRLYKTQTASSAASKARTPVGYAARRGGNFSTPPSAKSRGTRRTPSSGKSTGSSVDDSVKIFQRLHITGTAANASKRLSSKHHHPPRFSSPKQRSPHKNMPSMRTPLKSASKKSSKIGYVYSPRMQPLTALYFDSKYHPGIGKEKVEPIKLGSNFFQNFCEYENGGLTSEQIAREIIIAFFKKDFPAGRYVVTGLIYSDSSFRACCRPSPCSPCSTIPIVFMLPHCYYYPCSKIIDTGSCTNRQSSDVPERSMATM
jgi:hypothetical protein